MRGGGWKCIRRMRRLISGQFVVPSCYHCWFNYDGHIREGEGENIGKRLEKYNKETVKLEEEGREDGGH